MEDDTRIAEVRALAQPILEERGMELVELTCHFQGGQAQIRLLVDCVGGVTLAQCAQVNRLLNQALEHAPGLAGGFTPPHGSPVRQGGEEVGVVPRGASPKPRPARPGTPERAGDGRGAGFTLEVSSPGVDRPLVSPRDFQRALGEALRLECRQPGGAARLVEGVLLAVQGDAVVLKSDDGVVTVPLADLCWAKKAFRVAKWRSG